MTSLEKTSKLQDALKVFEIGIISIKLCLMKIGTVSIKTIQTHRRVKKADSAQGVFHFENVDIMHEAAGPVALNALIAPSALTPTETVAEKTKKALERGDKILEDLTGCLHTMLLNENYEKSLSQLKRTMRISRSAPGNSDVNILLEAIELRAEVEIAKADFLKNQYAHYIHNGVCNFLTAYILSNLIHRVRSYS